MQLFTYSLFPFDSEKSFRRAACDDKGNLQPQAMSVFKNLSFILSMICQGKAKSCTLNYRNEDSCITHQLKKSDNVEENCLGRVCQ